MEAVGGQWKLSSMHLSIVLGIGTFKLPSSSNYEYCWDSYICCSRRHTIYWNHFSTLILYKHWGISILFSSTTRCVSQSSISATAVYWQPILLCHRSLIQHIGTELHLRHDLCFAVTLKYGKTMFTENSQFNNCVKKWTTVALFRVGNITELMYIKGPHITR